MREKSHMVGKEEEEGRRKKAQKKPLCRDRDLNPQTLSLEPRMLSIRPWLPALYLRYDGSYISMTQWQAGT